MEQRRMINKVRTDYLEEKIAHYRAVGQDEKAEAILELAHGIGAKLDYVEIEKRTNDRIRFYSMPENH